MNRALLILAVAVTLTGCKSGYPYLTTEGLNNPANAAPWENNHDEVMGSVYRGTNTCEAAK